MVKAGRFSVYGNSMLPIIAHDSKVKIAHADGFSVGDIVVFKRKHYVLHRIVKIIGSKIITKGDNNPIIDKPIKKSMIIAKITSVNGRRIDDYNNKLIAQISYIHGTISSIARISIIDSFFRWLLRISF